MNNSFQETHTIKRERSPRTPKRKPRTIQFSATSQDRESTNFMKVSSNNNRSRSRNKSKEYKKTIQMSVVPAFINMTEKKQELQVETIPYQYSKVEKSKNRLGYESILNRNGTKEEETKKEEFEGHTQH